MTPRNRKVFVPAIFLIASVQFSACNGAPPEEGELIGTTKAPTFEQFEQATFQTPSGVYIVNGEPVRDELELKTIYDKRYGVKAGALTVNTVNGADDLWGAGTATNLTYCVPAQEFGDGYPLLVESLRSAAAQWESAADVKFVHLQQLDANCGASDETVFHVKSLPIGPAVAQGAAFFPSYERSQRVLYVNLILLVNPGGSEDNFPVVDVLTHEMGHILGLRHEHTREENGRRCLEGGTWRAVTSYDKESVMHYPWCDGTGQEFLQFTELDRSGIASLYGPRRPPVEEPPVEEPPVEEPPAEEPPAGQPPVEEPRNDL